MNAVLLGGTKGMGRALARLLATRGHRYSCSGGTSKIFNAAPVTWKCAVRQRASAWGSAISSGLTPSLRPSTPLPQRSVPSIWSS